MISNQIGQFIDLQQGRLINHPSLQFGTTTKHTDFQHSSLDIPHSSQLIQSKRLSSKGEEGKRRSGHGRSRQNHGIHLGSKGLNQEKDQAHFQP